MQNRVGLLISHVRVHVLHSQRIRQNVTLIGTVLMRHLQMRMFWCCSFFHIQFRSFKIYTYKLFWSVRHWNWKRWVLWFVLHQIHRLNWLSIGVSMKMSNNLLNGQMKNSIRSFCLFLTNENIFLSHFSLLVGVGVEKTFHSPSNTQHSQCTFILSFLLYFERWGE
jgi:hypothetical protein